MSNKKHFTHKWSAGITVEVTEGGYLVITQPEKDDELQFLLTPDQSLRLANYIKDNLKEQRSKWGSGESGDK
jgi:hypothetical protein